MDLKPTENHLSRIEELENRLAEAEQLIEAIKAGEVDAFALNANNHPEVFTLHSGDYAYRVLVENFSEGAVNLSDEGLIVYTNTSFHETLGLTYEKVIGASIFTFIHPASKETFNDLFKKGLAGQSKGEINLIAGKKTYPVHVSLTSLYPTLPTVGMIVTDLTEKKQAIKELEAKKELQNLFLQATTAIQLVKGPEFIYEISNKRALEISGKTEDEVIGKKVIEVIPEAKEYGLIDLLQQVYNTGETFVMEEMFFSFLKKGNSTDMYVKFTYKPIKDLNGNVYAIMIIGDDITAQVIARKKIEESAIENSKFAALVNSSEDAICSKTLDGIITSWNPGAEKIFGFTEAEMIGQPITKIIPRDRLEEEPHIIRQISRGKIIDHFETKRLTKKGNLIDISLTISPIRNKDGIIVGASKIARDITQEKRSHEKLKELKDQLDLSISAGKIGVWHLNIKNNMLHWSKEQCELYGITEKEFDATPEAFWQFVNPADLKRLQKETEENFKTQKAELIHQFRITRADGAERWIESRTRTQYDKEGKPEIITGINIDITEEKLFAHELEEKVTERTGELNRQKDFIETIVNSTPDLVGAYDTDTRIIAFNKACEDLFKIKREDVIGKYYTEAFPAAKGGQGEKDLLRALSGETIHNAIFHSAVTGKYYENYISPLRDDAGKIYAAVAIAHDITENIRATELIKQSEEKFSKLFESSPLAISLTEMETGKIIDVNENYLELTGFTREEVIGFTSVDLKMIEKETWEKIFKQLIEQGNIKNVEAGIRKKSGQVIPILVSSECIKIGEQNYFLHAINDITDRKKAEQKIEEKNVELQKMNKELEAFTYISSHDLQEPLRKIQTFAGRIIEREKQNLSETGQDYFQRMQEAATRMQTLLKDLLSFSRLATTERKFEITDLNEILQEVKAELKEAIETKNATIEAGDLCRIKIISFQFRQLLHNLISNSLKFSKPDVPPHIIIKSIIATGNELNNQKLVAEKKYCHLSFSDNGIGFEEQFSEKIFEVFQKLHGKDEYSGTGIGLAIVKKIVDNHHGIISAKGELGKGAVFNIYLPV